MDFNNTEELIKISQENIDNEYTDEELETSNKNPLEVNAYEQIKLFLTDAKNFFTSNLIESVAYILSSKHAMDSDESIKLTSDIVLSFSKICNDIDKAEEQYGSILHKTLLDKIIIKTIHKVSELLISDTAPYSNYVFRNMLDQVSNEPEFFTDIQVNSKIKNEIDKICTDNIQLNIPFLLSMKNTIEAKNKSLNAIKSIQEYTKFLATDAARFNNMEEFLKRAYEILNDTTSNLSHVVDDESEGIALNSVLSKDFLKTVVRTRQDHIKCGISIFDSITNGGFERDRVYLFSGKTGGGKSTTLLNIGYGMYKCGNGILLPELNILKKMAESDSNIKIFDDYCKANIAKIRENDKDNKTHLILYISLENTDYETIKRYMCRMGFLTSIFWELIERDPILKNCVNTDNGFKFTIDNLPTNMDYKLKRRLIAISSFLEILNKYKRTEFKVIWKPAYSISTFDILAMIKKQERLGYIVDSVLVDYPDKMKPVNSDSRKSDQSWDSLGKIIDNLKALAKQCNIPVLGVSQITRQGNKDSGNKNTILKAGNTAGSQQKESNTDTLVNMNFYSKDDNELNSKMEVFNNYQRVLNQNRMNAANQLFISSSSNIEDLSRLIEQNNRSTDILQIGMNMPDIQETGNYIVKNRDGISDITFQTYIVFGIYLISDYGEEAINCAEYAAETYRMITEYMYKNGMLDQSSLQVSNGMLKYFEQKLANFKAHISNNIQTGFMNNFNPTGNNSNNGGGYNNQQSKSNNSSKLRYTIPTPPSI